MSAPPTRASLIRRTWAYVRPHRVDVVLMLLCLPLEALLRACRPLLVRRALDVDVAGHDATGLAVTTLEYALVVGGLIALIYAHAYLRSRVGGLLTRDLRRHLFRHLQRLPMMHFDTTPVGGLMSRMTNDLDVVGEAFASGTVAFLSTVVVLAGVSLSMFAVSFYLAGWVMLALPVMLLVMRVLRRHAREAFAGLRVTQSNLTATLQEQLSGMPVTQAYAVEAQATEVFETANGALLQASTRVTRYDAGLPAVAELVASLSMAMLLGAAVPVVMQHEVSLGQLVALVELVGQFFGPIRELTQQYAGAQNSVSGLERAFAVIDLPVGPLPEGAAPTPRFEDSIVFSDVHFSYVDGGPGLKGVSLAIGKGQTVALVGTTGAGKSTVVKLLTRLYELSPRGRGSIAIDGVPLQSIAVESLRRMALLLPQDAYLFEGTIEDNVAFGLASEMSQSERAELVKRSIDAVGATPLFARLENGLHSRVSEGGTNLSAGERQLVALARAWARSPEILLLDEATSSVDPRADAVVQAATEKLLAGRTALVIAHRLSTIERADRIVVMADGQIVEEGTHAELMQRGGRYTELRKQGAAES